MIVDDDRITVGLLRTLLELDGFDVVLAGDGSSAFGKAKQESPDAFLVDYHLAEFEGTDFVRELRETQQFGKTPIIMTSGLNREAEASAAGANKFLLKPFDPGELVILLSLLIEGS
jgi:two-component system response regulator CpxR